MMKANPAPQEIKSITSWHMPILPACYPDRQPLLTNEEKGLMHEYVSAAEGHMVSWRTKKLLEKLTRFEIPFRDTMKLVHYSRQQLAVNRRHIFTYMLRTGSAFWAWPKEMWIEVIQAVPAGLKPSGTRFCMIILAYLFGEFLYIGPATSYTPLANIIFGKTVMDAEIEKVYAPLADAGYSTVYEARTRFRWICSLALLINSHPCVEALSAQTIVTLDDLLPAMSDAGQFEGRQNLIRLQTALCQLDILDEPIIFEATKRRLTFVPASWQEDPTIDPLWASWVHAFYEQTPHRNEATLRQLCYTILLAGRWLKKIHPEVREPAQWDEALAAEYVAYTCRAIRGDQMLPSNSKYAQFHNAPQPLSPGGIDTRLRAMRSFFLSLQRRSYTVNGKLFPRLQITWLPKEAFRTPDDVVAARQPNPRDIQEDSWFKLIWAACTLSKEKLLATNRNPAYPLAYFRAACLIWVTAARRSDEIRRLQVGCVRREWVPEMRDEQGNQLEPEAELAYIRIPTNKMKGEYYVPVPLYVADAIEVWESLRPPNQKPLKDRKTHKPTKYLFQYRNELMGRSFLNRHAIPLLCKLAGVNQTDVVGKITSHRARATTATWLHKMGMAPADIGKLLGHTNPVLSLPWYLREDKHRLGRAYRKANPLERYVAAILDTNAHARQEPCVFYYLADGPDGRPRMCGNPHFSRCIHQLMCIECEAFIDHEQAEAIEKREGTIVISVPIPLPPQMVAELNEQDEAGSDAKLKLESLPPPTLPSPAFHFNKKVPLRSAPNASEDLPARLAQVEAQIAQKRGKVDQRSASLQALVRERAELQARLAAQKESP